MNASFFFSRLHFRNPQIISRKIEVFGGPRGEKKKKNVNGIIQINIRGSIVPGHRLSVEANSAKDVSGGSRSRAAFVATYFVHTHILNTLSVRTTPPER